MTYVVAGLVAVATVAVLNLILTMGVIRRLREHSEALAHPPAPALPDSAILPAGARPADFTATDVSGAEITLASMATPTLVGFFSPSCPSCQDWLPKFVAAAGELTMGRAQALAVVTANDQQEAADYVEALGQVAQVVVEPIEGPVAAAFQVQLYPAFCRLDEDATVLTSDRAEALSAPARA